MPPPMRPITTEEAAVFESFLGCLSAGMKVRLIRGMYHGFEVAFVAVQSPDDPVEVVPSAILLSPEMLEHCVPAEMEVRRGG